MNIRPTRSYHARDAGRAVCAMPDARSVFKVYYVDIIGRADPARTEWDQCGLARDAFLTDLRASGLEGVGFATAFPHITKVFRFAPSAEIVMHVRAFDTRGLAALDLNREDGFTEFACYAEALIAADEYRFWAETDDIDAYLEQWSAFADAPIANHAKLAARWQE